MYTIDLWRPGACDGKPGELRGKIFKQSVQQRFIGSHSTLTVDRQSGFCVEGVCCGSSGAPGTNARPYAGHGVSDKLLRRCYVYFPVGPVRQTA
jgi:hypothetical protein